MFLRLSRSDPSYNAVLSPSAPAVVDSLDVSSISRSVKSRC